MGAHKAREPEHHTVTFFPCAQSAWRFRLSARLQALRRQILRCPTGRIR